VWVKGYDIIYKNMQWGNLSGLDQKKAQSISFAFGNNKENTLARKRKVYWHEEN